MKKNCFKILLILLVLFGLFFTKSNNVEAHTFDTNYTYDVVSDANSDLTFRLTKVVSFGPYKIITINVTNSSSTNDYSFGWVNSCKLTAKTDSSTVREDISSGTISFGSHDYTYTFKLDGDITSLVYSDIRKLDSNGLPLYNQSYEISCNISSYKSINGLTITLISVIAVALIIFMTIVILKKREKNPYKIIGSVVTAIGTILIVYSVICFATKPSIFSSDFMSLSKKYWILGILGMLIVITGSLITNKGKNSKTVDYSDNEFYKENKIYNDKIMRSEEEIREDKKRYDENHKC